jgi:hypothetical protein
LHLEVIELFRVSSQQCLSSTASAARQAAWTSHPGACCLSLTLRTEYCLP